ncbi:MAG: glycosyltransferase family 2 protein [Alphaproteobacteria bacterium]
MSIYKKTYPTFTIITVTLNNFEGLTNTAASIDRQTFDDFEWIVVDGASKDESLDFLRQRRSTKRTEKYPFAFISEEDNGIYDAMNHGITQASGKYLLFLNAGDVFAHNDVLSEIAPHTKKKPNFIYGDALEPTGKAESYNYKKARRYKDIQWGMITHHQAMFYSRLTIRDCKLHYSLLYTVSSDYDFTLRFLQKSRKCSYYAKPICIFEQGGLSQQQAALGRKEQYIIREKLHLIPTYKNLWIMIVQMGTWHIKKHIPQLYWLLQKVRRDRS